MEFYARWLRFAARPSVKYEARLREMRGVSLRTIVGKMNGKHYRLKVNCEMLATD